MGLWWCKKVSSGRILAYCEYQPEGNHYFYTDYYTMSNPYLIVGANIFYLQMNFGAPYTDYYGTWYLSTPSNYLYDEYDRYVEDYYITCSN